AAYVKPEVLCIDELGYQRNRQVRRRLPVPDHQPPLRARRHAVDETTNRIYKQWAGIFNGDATLTSALLDRLLDHVETVLIEGKSYRGQDHAEA
ncbi:MAG: ATP-binding protein, partial [Burkholderiaceae bacterium]